MIDRIYDHPTAHDTQEFDERSGKDRRVIHTTVDPDRDRRKGERRKRRR
jgi:hypothetical protein